MSMLRRNLQFKVFRGGVLALRLGRWRAGMLPGADWAIRGVRCRGLSGLREWLGVGLLSIQRFTALVIVLASLAGGSSLWAEKSESWLEVRSPHFVLVSNGLAKTGRRVALQFEMIRAVFRNTFPKARVDPAQLPIILAVKDEESLKALLPAFWEQKGGIHPEGYFLGGQEKQYVALRTDTSVDPKYYSPNYNPYQTIYHEYIHLLVNLNYRWLPLWLSEGLAELYGSTRIMESRVDLGRPIEYHLELFRRQRLLPLPILFAVDYASPYYNKEHQATVFYAESWALTHFLILGERGKHSQKLVAYIVLLNNDVNPTDAATQAFGDLKKLGNRLDLYLRGLTMPSVQVKQPVEVVEDNFAVRALSPAESATVRGDFHVYNRRLADGRALLEEALRLKPNYAPAHESMGFLHFREGKKEEAARFFDEAVKLDSRNYLAHYFHAMLVLEQNSSGEVPEGVVHDLKRTIKLNPDFPSAYLSLASVYGTRGQNLEEARGLAAKAINLEPGNLQGHLVLAHILLRQERPAEAAKICRRVLAATKTAEERAGAESLLSDAQQYSDYQAEMKQRAEEARATAEEEARIAERMERERAARKKLAWEDLRRVEPVEPTTDTTEPSAGGMQVTVEGKVIEVSCTVKGALRLTLACPIYNLELQAANYHQVKLVAAEGNPPDGFNLCRQLKGLQAKITHKAGGADAGEIVSIELRK